MSLTRKKPMPRSGPINKVSDKKQAVKTELRKLKRDRMKIAGDCCENPNCRVHKDVRLLDYAHIILGVGRTPALELDRDNAIILCRPCHTWYTNHPRDWEIAVKSYFPCLWERLEARHMEVKKG